MGTAYSISVLLILFYFLPSVTMTKVENTLMKKALSEFIHSRLKIVQRLDNIPPALIRSLEQLMSKAQRIADPGEFFNSTDVIMPNLPSRRLLFAGSSNSRWLLCYEKGGEGIQTIVVIFSKSKGEIIPEWAASFAKKISSLKDLIFLYDSGQYERLAISGPKGLF